MARQPGPQSEKSSQPIGLRLPNDLFQAVCQAAGIPLDADGRPEKDAFKSRFPEWARNVFRAAVGKGPKTMSQAQLAGYEEGKRQGWARANEVFREALKQAMGQLK